MKRFLILTFAFVAILASCGKQADPLPVEPQLPVNFTNTAGDWVLSTWQGNDMSATPVYIRLNSREFTIWQSVGSMYPTSYTGSYNIYEEEGTGMIIRGLYDYTYEYWSHRYLISSLTASHMEWTSLDNPEDVYLYVRTDSFPE